MVNVSNGKAQTMKSRFHIFLFSLLTISFAGCVDKDEAINTEGNSQYAIVGSYYGMCIGDECIKYVMVVGDKVYELKNISASQDGPISYSGHVELPADKAELFKNLPSSIPSQLYSITEKVIGCPDCADGGGTYIETTIDGTKRYWYIDNTINEPEYLKEWIGQVNEKIRVLKGN